MARWTFSVSVRLFVIAISSSTLHAQQREAPPATAIEGRAPVALWLASGLAFGQVGRTCSSCSYDSAPFPGIVISLAAGVEPTPRMRLGVELNQWFEIDAIERADKRSMFSTLTVSIAPARQPKVALKGGIGGAWHHVGSPDVSARGPIVQAGVAYRFRLRGLSPVAVADLIIPVGGAIQSKRPAEAGTFRASLLKIGLGLDWTSS